MVRAWEGWGWVMVGEVAQEDLGEAGHSVADLLAEGLGTEVAATSVRVAASLGVGVGAGAAGWEVVAT
jgi:hypothetical protein